MQIKRIIYQNVNSAIANLVCKHCGCMADRYITSNEEDVKNIKCPNCGKTEKDK